MPNLVTNLNDARAIAGAIACWIHVEGSLVKNAFEQEGTDASNMMFTLDRITYELENRHQYQHAVVFWFPTDLATVIGEALNVWSPCVCTDEMAGGCDACLYPRWVEFVEDYRDTKSAVLTLRKDRPSEYEDRYIVLPPYRDDREED